jgi:hypothetical protein
MNVALCSDPVIRATTTKKKTLLNYFPRAI